MMLSSNSSCCNFPPCFPENDITITSSFFTTSPHFYLDDHHHFCLDLHQHHTAMPPLSNHSSSVAKPAKKDRHSKINTARGPRDRRMRLSLEIARKFFDLQDMLGYDKASRTVEWLLTNSGAAIKELARAQNPSSDHSSTCEQERPPSSKSRARREKVKRVVGRATVGKESRTKARERARERTSQKRRLINTVTDELKVQTTGASESLGFAFNHAADHLQPPPWNPAAGFSYHAGQNAAFLNQEDEEIVEFEFSGKAWEDFNAFNLPG